MLRQGGTRDDDRLRPGPLTRMLIAQTSERLNTRSLHMTSKLVMSRDDDPSGLSLWAQVTSTQPGLVNTKASQPRAAVPHEQSQQETAPPQHIEDQTQPGAAPPQPAQNQTPRDPGTPAAVPHEQSQSTTPGAVPHESSQPHENAADDQIDFVAVGDVMLGTTFPDATGASLPPNDGVDILQEVTPILKRGDITFGNLEGPLVDGGVSAKCRGKALGTCYAFRVPTRYGQYLKDAGFTVMGVANNHAMDFGQEGRTSSRTVLDSLGIAHTGEVGDIAHLTVKGRKVAVIAFATYPGAYNLLDLDAALQAIRDARAESDIVIVSFHGGAEGATHQHVPMGDETFLGEDRGDVRRFAHAAIDAGAQLVVGSGPHVVRGMELYQGKLIAYSLGNFATYGPFNLSAENGIAMVLEARLASDGTFLGGHAYPTKQDKPGGPKLDPEMRILPVVRELSKIDFGRDAVVVADNGDLTVPEWQLPECTLMQLLNLISGPAPCAPVKP